MPETSPRGGIGARKAHWAFFAARMPKKISLCRRTRLPRENPRFRFCIKKRPAAVDRREPVKMIDNDDGPIRGFGRVQGRRCLREI